MKEPDGRDESGRGQVGSGRVPENFEIPEGIGFFKKVEIPENLATVSRTTLQYSLAACKICKYTVRVLLPVKLLETRTLRIV